MNSFCKRNIPKITICLLSSLLLSLWPTASAFGQTASVVSGAVTAHAATERDGQHDFDVDFGTWKTHTSRLQHPLQHPLTGSTKWIEMDGVTVVRKVWDGQANLAELESDGPNGHLELLALLLYNPQAHQWSINFATSNVGVLNAPSGQVMIGEFKNGRGVFYDQEPYNGKTIWVRFTMTPLTADTAQSEQAFSNDAGDELDQQVHAG